MNINLKSNQMLKDKIDKKKKAKKDSVKRKKNWKMDLKKKLFDIIIIKLNLKGQLWNLLSCLLVYPWFIINMYWSWLYVIQLTWHI